MSRRDTIIIAVLVNVALLMILFVTAMRSDRPEKKVTSKESYKSKDLAVNSGLEPLNPAENILNEYITGIPVITELKPGSSATFEETGLVLIEEPEKILELAPKLPFSEEIKTPKQTMGENFANITVKKGDFLEKIAKANNTTVAVIMDMNRLSTTQLKIGQVLKVPLDGKLPQKTASLSASIASNHEEYYIVKEGDSPWLIASRNKIKLDELLRLNGLDEQKAKRLHSGDKLRIR